MASRWPSGVYWLKLAGWPGRRLAMLASRPRRVAGWLLAQRAACSREQPVKWRRLATARSRVRTEPARVSGASGEGGFAVVAGDGQAGESVVAVGHAGGGDGVGDEDGAVAFEAEPERTSGGVTWMPSQMSSAKSL